MKWFQIYIALMVGAVLTAALSYHFCYLKSDVQDRALRHKNGYWHPNSGRWKWIDHSNYWSDAKFRKLNLFLESVHGSPTKEEWKQFLEEVRK